MFRFVVFAAALAYANAGLLGAPAVAAYSAAPAVSSAYISQAAPVAVAHAAPLAVAHAAPLAVAHAPVAVHAPAIGASHQSVVRSLGGNQAVSHYSKAVDSAFSSVRKFDTRITNDALTVAHAPVAVAHAAPVVSTYAAHAPVVSSYAAHAPVAYAAPAVAHAPLAYAAHAPVVAKTAAVPYSPAAVVSHATFSGLGASYAW
ncbi:Cuticle 3 domain containing protein [Asbolus verrucosus]|uniref:Cuticle 3 domain containing protein n=1 Tax=Asbolus verrucosus TaxID=1661398 RepID=A0A482VGC4_ASBVE|nr:Cuticle 3 domain containing protein [Asbolus verrucosus]